MSWKYLCDSADVARNTLKLVDLDGTNIVVANYGEGFRAIPPLCPHMNQPLAESGVIGKCALTCMKHLWSWDLGTLEKIGETEKTLLTYDLKEKEGKLMVWFEQELSYNVEEEDDMDDVDFFNN